MALIPSRQLFYVGRKADRAISTYRRNCETGEMSLAGTYLSESNRISWLVDRKRVDSVFDLISEAGCRFSKLAAMES